MTFALKLEKAKVLLMVLAALAIGLVAAPTVTEAATTDTLGIAIFEDDIDLGNNDIRETIAEIINVALSLLGIVAVVIILIGGFQWMTAGGNEEKVASARKLIFAGIIGLAIILSALAIAKFVLDNLATATNLGNTNGTDPL